MKSLYRNGGFIGKVQSYTDLEPYITATPATITFVAARSGNFLGSTTVGQTLDITTMGLQYGDIIIVAYECCGTVNKTLSISGYTTIAKLYANDTEDSNLLVAFKLMGPVPDTEIVIPPTQNADDAGAYVLHAYRGVNLTRPFDVTSTTVSLTNTGIPNPPAITPVTSGAHIVVAAGTAHTTGTGEFIASYLSNFTTRSSNDTNDATVGMGDVAWPGGAYDPAAWTFTGTNSTNFSTNSVTMALRPGFVLGNKKNSGIWNINAEKISKTTTPSAGEITFDTPGTYSWPVPLGVNSISGICVGGGGGGGARGTNSDEAGAGGGGGALAYSTFAVTPGEILTVTVQAGGAGGQATAAAGFSAPGSGSEILRGGTALVRATGGLGGGGGTGGATPAGGLGGTVSVGTGGNGGSGGTGTDGGGTTGLRGGGGGAGGYSGFGGIGANNGATTGGSGNGSGGGGGGGTSTGTTTGGGGGVGIFGQVSNGVGGTATVNATGGSLGESGTYAGGLYGGGGSGGGSNNRTNAGANGAVRIIWGPFTFPSNAGVDGITSENIELGIQTLRQIEYVPTNITPGASIIWSTEIAGSGGSTAFAGAGDIQVGDVLFAISAASFGVYDYDGGGNPDIPQPTAANGFSTIYLNGSQTVSMYIVYKIITAGNISSTSYNSGNGQLGTVIYNIRGLELTQLASSTENSQSSLTNNLNLFVASGNTGTIVRPSAITPAYPNSVILTFSATGTNTFTPTLTRGYSLIRNYQFFISQNRTITTTIKRGVFAGINEHPLTFGTGLDQTWSVTMALRTLLN